MGIELITDLGAIRHEIGLRLEEASLYPKLNLDAFKDVSPVLVKDADGRYSLLAKEVETGNFTAGGAGEPALKQRGVTLLRYGDYFTWERVEQAQEKFPADEVGALKQALSVDKLTVHGDMALSRYRRLAEGFGLTVVPTDQSQTRVFAYRLDPAATEAAYRRGRDAVGDWAHAAIDRELTAPPRDKATLHECLSAQPFSSFGVLGSLLGEAGLGGVLASSPINVQEMTGRSFQAGDLGLYCGGSLHFLSERPVTSLPGGVEYPSLSDAIAAICPDVPLGVEEKNLEVQRALPLGPDVRDASNLFRAWRELRSAQDLGAYILGALSTRFAIEAALQEARATLEAGGAVYEKHVEEAFYRNLETYASDHQAPLALKPYFMVLHSGGRTPYPSLPGTYEVSESARSLKLDAGVLVKDGDLVLGCSDLARTLVTDESGLELYELLEESMLTVAIPGGREGRTGEDVYRTGIEPLVQREAELKAGGYLPAQGKMHADYDRDIGHTFGKQESTTLFFKQGETSQKLKAGMVSAIEYQWPYDGFALGVEDMYMVGPEYGINITR